MRVALYARYSSDMQREASIEDQFRNCEKHLNGNSWKITYRFKDEALSGSTDDRPGYKKLIQAAESESFDVLLVDDLSRLSRDEIELKQTVRRFHFWGIRIVGVSDGFDTDSKGYKIQAGVRGLMNEIYLDELREKTHRGMTGQALKGFNTGGRCYGYRHVRILDETRRDEYGEPLIIGKRREIDPDHAEWVVKIFEWYADGNSPRWIAQELNRLRVPSLRGAPGLRASFMETAGESGS